jgi:hypothetical protein
MTTRRHIAAVEAGSQAPSPWLGIGVPGLVIPHEGSVIAPVNLPARQPAVPAAVDLIEKLVPDTRRKAGA